MSSSSDGSGARKEVGSSSDSSVSINWQCKHCKKEIPNVKFRLPLCVFCGMPQPDESTDETDLADKKLSLKTNIASVPPMTSSSPSGSIPIILPDAPSSAISVSTSASSLASSSVSSSATSNTTSSSTTHEPSSTCSTTTTSVSSASTSMPSSACSTTTTSVSSASTCMASSTCSTTTASVSSASTSMPSSACSTTTSVSIASSTTTTSMPSSASSTTTTSVSSAPTITTSVSSAPTTTTSVSSAPTTTTTSVSSAPTTTTSVSSAPTTTTSMPSSGFSTSSVLSSTFSTSTTSMASHSSSTTTINMPLISTSAVSDPPSTSIKNVNSAEGVKRSCSNDSDVESPPSKRTLTGDRNYASVVQSGHPANAIPSNTGSPSNTSTRRNANTSNSVNPDVEQTSAQSQRGGKNKDNTQPSSENKIDQERQHQMALRSRLPGFRDSLEDDTLAVTFNVIVPIQYWGFDDKSKVRLRFGPSQLGSWSNDAGNFTIKRKTDDGLLVMQCDLYIAVNVLRNSIPYKYCVYTKEKTDISECFEYFHDAPRLGSHIVNRCLSVPERLLKSKGAFFQYDGMILPQKQPPANVIKKIWKYISGSSRPSHDTVQELSLNVFLETPKQKFMDSKVTEVAKANFANCLTIVYTIFEQLRKPLICGKESSSRCEWPSHRLTEVFVKWLRDILEHLECIDIKSRHEYGERMCSVLVILRLLQKVIPQDTPIHTFLDYYKLHTNWIVRCFSMMLMEPEEIKPNQWVIKELDVLMKFVHSKSYSEVSNCLVTMVNYVIKDKHLLQCQWLYVLPLIHIFRLRIKPFENRNLSNIQWDDEDVKLPTMMRTSVLVDENSTVMQDVLREMSNLVHMDGLLLQRLVYICPKQELPYMFGQIPILLAVKYLSFLLHQIQGRASKMRLYQVPMFVETLKVLATKVTLASTSETVEEKVITSENALSVFSKMLEVLPDGANKSSPCEMCVLLCLTLLLYSLNKADSKFKSEYDERLKTTDQVLRDVRRLLTENWIVMYYSPIFGSPYHHFKTQAAKDEIQVFHRFAQIDCPSDLKRKWEYGILQEILQERIFRIKDLDDRMDLLVVLEAYENPNVIVTDVILDAVMKSFERMNSQDSLKFEILYAKTNKHRKVVGQILDKKLSQKIKTDTEYIPITDLLEWDLWPLFISIHRNKSMRETPYLNQSQQSQSILSEHSDLMCTIAYSTLEVFVSKCQKGAVTLHDINVIADNKVKMLKLYTATITGKLEGGKLAETDEFQILLEHRIQESKTFLEKWSMLNLFCQHLKQSKVLVVGLDYLIEEIEADHMEKSICKLCIIQDRKASLMVFQNSHSVLPILPSFNTCFHLFPNDITSYFWTAILKDLRQKKEGISFDNFESKVWNPFFGSCSGFLVSIREKTIKLREVHNMDKYVERNHEITEQLHLLFNAIEVCQKRPPSSHPPSWVVDGVTQMKKYLSLCDQARAAGTVLQLRNKLQLKGNFSVVESLSQEFSFSMQDQFLNSINPKMFAAASFLEKLTSRRDRWICIETFSKCLDVVEWIRKETKEIMDLQKFVSVALHTSAGEGDLSSDKLSNLKMAGSGYGPLIYNLFHDPSFEVFQNCCEEVWKSLEQMPNLPVLLKACNDELEWFKSVKETQASVEVTSIVQMNNILKCGCYFIGSKKSKIFQDLHDIISLELQEKDQRLVKKKYNLEELRDLESKLILITGSKAEHRTQVDLFLDILHSLCHIASVLLCLQQVGNVQYTGWLLQVPCTPNREVVNALQELATNMELELEKWNENVKCARKKYYELNYYTTLQLLSLREKLGIFKASPVNNVVSPNILVLLQSVRSEIDQALVAKAVRRAISNDGVSIFEHSSVASERSKSHTASMCESIDHALGEINKQPHLSKPNLSNEDLNEDQRKTMAHVVSRIHCSEQLVLKSFEALAHRMDCDQYDYVRWCAENADLDSINEEYSGSDADSDMEIESEDDEFNYTSDVVGEKTIHLLSGKLNIVAKDIPMLERIDENHSIVQELHQLHYSQEESIEAVERTGAKDIASAIEYLQDKDENDDDTSNPLIPVYHKQFSQQESNYFDNEVINWTDFAIHLDRKAENRYLTLEQLGDTLKYLNDSLSGGNKLKRPFPSNSLKEGFPNLLVLQPDLILKGVLCLYMEDSDLPLPSLEEVLLCNSSTTAEEVDLFWMRAIHDPGYARIFCLVNAEKLSNVVCDKALHSLSELTQGQKGYRLVIFYSNGKETDSHFISKLQNYRRVFMPHACSIIYKEYLTKHFVCQGGSQSRGAAVVDHENLRVRIVTSYRSAMGKSLYIQRLAENLKKTSDISYAPLLTTVPLHGPNVTCDTLLRFLKDHMKHPSCCIYHIDIASSVLGEVDMILFSLLVLQGVCDSHGQIWRCHPDQLYVVEATLPDVKKLDRDIPEYLAICLLEMLPTISCLSPCEAFEATKNHQSNHSELVMDTEVFISARFQRVFQYLRHFIGGSNLDTFHFAGTVEGAPQDFLQIILHYCGVKDPSWAEIRHFVTFLDHQLNSCEQSVFTDHALTGDVMAGLKGFVVKFMISMSRDFSTSSLQGEVAIENAEDVAQGGLSIYEISERKKWEQIPHPYIFFNQDGMSITFVGFMVQLNGPYGDLINPNDYQILEKAIISKQLYEGLKHNRVDFKDNCKNWTKSIMIEKLATVLGVEFPYDPDDTYVLTVDNVIKILAIQMRFRCNIPVVIMGETGCGKTRLIRYMCDLVRQGKDTSNMLILKVHGGTTENEIENFVKAASDMAKRNKSMGLTHTIAFFDEANTTDALGLIKEIMCDRRINGKPITSDIKFIAACNPYRKHNDEMIERLENAGLGFFVRATETQQRLGKIPLRQLVYRVLDLPPSMRPLVYDFGQLNRDTERDYIGQIVQDHIKNHSGLSLCPNISIPVADVLKTAQAYMRERNNECSFVSLRDVERAMMVFKYFFDKMALFGPKMDAWACGNRRHVDNTEDDMESEHYAPPNDVTRALILSVSVCYRARLQQREQFDKKIVNCFVKSIGLTYGEDQFRDEIRWCEEVFLENMNLGNNIAKNSALRENVFMMVICIELRIPLFLVGKPGSSKSLAKAIISDSMRGKDSKSELLRQFKEVGIFSYQCSQLSTSDSVIEVFKNAERFQTRQDKSSYVAVVVLDEVGLAEDSPNLPLKALHPLLEDGTEGRKIEKGDFSDEIVDQQERVAFIGISNWALDPAKMNRGVMVTRADPSEKELVFSAKGICSNEDNDPIKIKLERYFSKLAKAYMAICKKQEREFFGLRDFYSLIKMLYNMCKMSGRHLTWQQLEHAIKRNFGGLESSKWKPFDEFEKLLIMDRKLPDLEQVPNELHHVVCPDCSRLGLIRTSLANTEKTWHGENRYVLFLTENYAALDILINPTYLQTDIEFSQMNMDSNEHQPFILFGSSFPKDKEYTQVCRNINQIKICMETGRTVILLNLENLYESLYDVLNQYYIYHAESRYVDLGLQTHRVRCRVANNFRLILIAEKNTVYQKFPTPLINRLEKHFVLTSSILEEWQEKVLEVLEKWIFDFSTTSSSTNTFKESDAFIGYQKDTPASVIFHASNQLRRACSAARDSKSNASSLSQRVCRILQQSRLSPAQFDVEERNPTMWADMVLHLSQYFLLLTASPDSIIRLKETSLYEEEADICNIYFQQQHHDSILDFLSYHLEENFTTKGLLIQVTTHSHLLSSHDITELGSALMISESHFSLHAFDTELDFSNKISPLFQRSSENCLVVIQCDSGHLNGDLIACARYRIYDLRAKACEGQTTHVLFIIHLPQQIPCSLVGFQGEPWISAHIDDLKPARGDTVNLQDVIGGVCISAIFFGGARETSTNDDGLTPCMHQDSQDMIDEKNMATWAEKASSSPNRTKVDILSMDMSVEDIEDEQFNEDSINEIHVLDHEMHVPLGSTIKELEPKIRVARLISGGNTIFEQQNLESESIALSSCQYNLKLQYKNPLFRRLFKCIQPAIAKLKDNTMERGSKRVERLIGLIPKHIENDFDQSQFHGILISHIHKLLQEREELYRNEQNWIVKESLNSVNLIHGGTLSNALSRKVDEVVIHILAEIIAFVDHNCNLILIEPGNENSILSKFWLLMFENFQIMQFKFTNFVSREDSVQTRQYGPEYTCEFPFSWLIYEIFESLWTSVKSTVGSNKLQIRNQLCESVKQTDVGAILLTVEENYTEEFYAKYLHDFVQIVSVASQTNNDLKRRQYELVAESLDALLRGDDFCTMDGNVTLIDRIATLHVVYQLHQHEVLCFGQLVRYNPGALVSIRNEDVRDKSEMILHLCAVSKALDCLTLKMEKDDETVNLIPWLHDIRVSQNIVTSIVNMPSQCELRRKARLKWNAIRVLQLFVDHLMQNHSSIPIFYLRRLQYVLTYETDFMKASGLVKVQKNLNALEKEAKRKPSRFIKEADMNKFKKNCCRYFMEVVSTVCFGQESAPDSELIRMLMQIIFYEHQTRDLIPFKKFDSKPTIRSSLLQLLLDYNSADVKMYLNDYFESSCRALSQHSDSHLSLLCIHCFEDALHKQYSPKDYEDETINIRQILEKAHHDLYNLEGNSCLTMSYLEAIAGARFGLSVVARLLHSQCCEPQTSESNSVAVLELIDQARDICLNEAINAFHATWNIGPGVYLAKLLVREFGYSSLMEVSSKFNWVVPEGLMTTNQEKVLDPFVIYNESMGYASMRTDLSGAYIGKQLDHLYGTAKTLNIKKAAVLLLAFYESITSDYSNSVKSSMDDDLRDALDGYILNVKAFSGLMRQAARFYLTNKQGGPLAQMNLTPETPLACKTLATVVVHTVSVILSNNRNPVLFPFFNMMTNPGALANAYLPTMAEDPLYEVQKAGGRGKFYACPNGHNYFVGECGKPVEQRYCMVCQAPIGGANHQLLSDNRNARTNDATQTGHDLGDAGSRTGVASERSLSPPAICIIRAIMHSALLWCSCHYEDCISDITGIVKPYIHPEHLPEFFWRHLEKDVEQLSAAIGKNKDDASMLVHLVLKEILIKDSPNDGTIDTVKSLMAKNARQQWEKVFSSHYITPVVENLQEHLDQAMDLIARDDKQEHDRLFYLVHEKVQVTGEHLGQHLWTYRQKVSLEHLGLSLREETLRKKYPVLHEFLQMEPKLRAAQYLPHIVKLQQSLFDRFNYRLDRSAAMKWTIGRFLQNLRNENERNKYSQWIESLQKAWELIGKDLKTHGRMPVKQGIWQPAINLETRLDYLIPTTTHAGVCTTALVDFLTLTHNNFIEKCHGLVAGDNDREQMKWLKNDVPIAHIHQCHLLDYENKIISVVLSHCHYSLLAGEAHNVKYDYQSLQKHILDKFIHGKPMILSDIPQVVYRNDIHTTLTFEAVREKVKPQKRLETRVQKEILAELRTPDALRKNLDIIDTILGFLASGGGKPNKPLGVYIEKILKMQRISFSKKAQEYCQLKHILSLWETLSVELAKLTCIRKQEPFNTVYEREYVIKLSEQQETDLDSCLRVFDLERLLGALYEFIETSMRYFPEEQLKWNLVEDVLVQDMYRNLDLPQEFQECFPKDITVSQTIATWKHIVFYQEKQLKQ